MPKSKIPWFKITDCRGNGERQIPVDVVYIQAATQKQAENVFNKRFDVYADQVTCQHCGPDFATYGPYENFGKASAFERNDSSIKFKYRPVIRVKEYRNYSEIRVIDARSIRPAELLGD